jgi:hypothetical protein
MSRALGFIGLIIVVAIGAVVYMKQVQSASPGTAEGGDNPQSTIAIAGVKNDLLAIAQAERAHRAKTGSYVSLDDLVSAGELSMARTRRGAWEYSSDVSEGSFKIIATYTGPATAGTGSPTRYVIDENMQVRAD